MRLMTPDPSAQPTPLVAVLVMCFVIGVAMYVWYGFALSRLFPKLGSEALEGLDPRRQ